MSPGHCKEGARKDSMQEPQQRDQKETKSLASHLGKEKNMIWRDDFILSAPGELSETNHGGKKERRSPCERFPHCAAAGQAVTGHVYLLITWLNWLLSAGSLCRSWARTEPASLVMPLIPPCAKLAFQLLTDTEISSRVPPGASSSRQVQISLDPGFLRMGTSIQYHPYAERVTLKPTYSLTYSLWHRKAHNQGTFFCCSMTAKANIDIWP